MNNKKISIIIPVYNAEKYISKCLDSILKQTYIDFEVICVNDGSLDDSLSIIESYKNKDKRVKVINQGNGGPSKARNCGLDNANGNYIVFIDADDYIEKNFLGYMLTDINNTDVSICNYIEVDDTGKHNISIFNFLSEEVSNINNSIINEVISGPGGLVWGKLFKSNIIKENNIRFNENYKMCEDLLFMAEYIGKANKVRKINKNLYIHNKCNENSITANYKSEMFFYQLEIQERLKKIIQNQKDDDVNEVLNKRLKDILMYSIYKETKNNKRLLAKLQTIKEIINCEGIYEEKRKFKKDGIIDTLLVQAINNNNVILIYFLTVLRDVLFNIYSKFKSLSGERVNA